MDFAQLLNITDNITSLTLLLISTIVAGYIFFIDPLRRWRFFGFLPTVVIMIIDPKTKNVLVVNRNFPVNIVTLPQGGIYSSDMLEAIQSTLTRELGLETNCYEIQYVRELGTAPIKIRKERLHKYQYGILSLSPTIQGKGYIGCICICDQKKLVKNLRYNYSIKSAKFVTLSEFKKIVVEDKDQIAKRQIYKALLEKTKQFIDELKYRV